MSARRLLIVVNSDWFFLSHRLPLAKAAAAAGYDVTVATIDTGDADRIRAHGFAFEALRLTHQGLNPLAELRSIAGLIALYRRLRPHIVHHVTIKPVLYGSIAARLLGGIGIVNAVPGLGYLFSSDTLRARLLRPLIAALYRIAMSGRDVRAIFQNPDDLARFVASGAVAPGNTLLIRGSGVDVDAFASRPEHDGPPIVLFASRMIWAKGVGDFVECARRVRRDMPHVRFVLAGKPDPGNPTAVPVAQLQAWQDESVVEWWRHRDDMPDVIAAAAIVALPTVYREGVPKILIEAAACGRPIITTDMPGCREIVHDDVNGRLIQPHDVNALVGAVIDLLRAPELRARYGAAGRRMAMGEFAVGGVVARTLAVYEELRTLRPRRHGGASAPAAGSQWETA